MILKGYLFSLLYGIVCLGLAFLLYKLGVPKKTTRKLVHILIGFEWVILNHFVGASVHFIAVCMIFLLMLIVAHRKSLMPMISSEGDNAPGTVYYAVAMTIMAIVTHFVPLMMYPFGIGVFCTSLGDGFAGLVGQSIPSRINPKIYGNKTLFGAISNFTVSFAATLAMSSMFGMDFGLFACIAIALFSLELELFTGKGLDNITITLGTAVLSYAFANIGSISNYIVPILVTPLIIAAANKKGALTPGGIIGALLLDVIISVSLGNFGFVILLTFFALGVATDKIKKKAKKSRQNTELSRKASNETRNVFQVFCNGGVGCLSSLLYLITGDKVFIVAFLASFAEALADTAASGIGALSNKTFDIFRMKRCDSGLSGGMSLIGTVASLAGAAVISVIAFAFGYVDFYVAIVVSLCGFFGGVFDSLLGSLMQVKYKCTVCGKITERKWHCGEETVHYCGFKFIDNNAVNFCGTLFAAVLSVALIYFN